MNVYRICSTEPNTTGSTSKPVFLTQDHPTLQENPSFELTHPFHSVFLYGYLSTHLLT